LIAIYKHYDTLHGGIKSVDIANLLKNKKVDVTEIPKWGAFIRKAMGR
jgi:hypothetical protein